MEARNLLSEHKLEEAKAKKEELDALQEELELMNSLDDKALEEIKDQIESGDARIVTEKPKNIVQSFVNVVKSAFKKDTALDEEDVELYNKMKEGTDEDGGLTVPEDISTTIKELRRSEDALENLVTVESVSTIKGSRVYEVNADATPFDNVDEEAEFPEVSTPTLRKINYAIKKKGGILKVTRELLMDSAENIMAFLKKWISKKAKATRNALILKQIDTITEGKEVAVTGIDDLKDIFNIRLDPAIAIASGIVINQDGFNFLDKLKDVDGKYILQPNPTQPTQKLLFGAYPVTVISNKVLKTVEGKAPVICGNLKEAITIFDRENLTIDISDVAAGLWETDQTGIKVRERLDIQTIDEEAIIKGQITVTPGE